MQRIVELEQELAQSRQEEKRMKKEVEELERRIKALCASHTA
jgi:phage shock protein A